MLQIPLALVFMTAAAASSDAQLAMSVVDAGPLARPARLNLERVPLANGLQLLHERSGVALAFSSRLVPARQLVSCPCESATVGQALDHMLAGLGLKATELGGDMVIIAPARNDRARNPEDARLPSAGPDALESVRADDIAGRIVGRVVASSGEPVGEAQIAIDGTGFRTTSGPDGRYAIAGVPDGTHRVIARRIGYAAESRTVTVAGGDVTLDFTMNPVSIRLDEVVVTGTAGQARRREVGNSIGTIDNERLAAAPRTTMSEMLQGQVAGVQQFANEGQVGSGSTITIRGLSSLTQSSEPLIYIDGVRVNNATYMNNSLTRTTATGNPGANGAQNSPKPLDNINPDDVLRIEVIRGPAATTLYGTEAAAGVIQVFTKRGQFGTRPQWNLTLGGGVRTQTANSLGPVVGKDPTFLGLKPFLRNGAQHEADLSVAGGNDVIRYFVAANHEYAEGTLPKNDSRRAGLRANFDFQPQDKLSIHVSSAFSNRTSHFLESGDNTYGFLLNVFRGSQDYTGGNHAMLLDIDNASRTDHLVTGVTLTHTGIRNVTSKLTVGIDYTNSFNDETLPFDFPLLRTGQRNTSSWTHRTLTADLASTWSKSLGSKLSSSFSAGGQFYHDYDHTLIGTAENFGGPGQVTLSSGANTRASEAQLTVVNAGFFVQEMLGFNDRFFVTVGARADGNSAFGSNLGLQLYPKVSASYVISDESFWPKWWQTMKLRGAWGQAGKAPGAFDAVRTWTPVAGYDGQPGVTPANVGNPDLGPERTSEVELGFETSVLDDRLSADVSYYRRTTNDALFRVTAPPSEGFLISSLRNVGTLRSNGLELSVTGVVLQKRNVELSLTGQYSTNESEVVDLGGAPAFTVGFASLGQWVRQGYPMVSVFGRQVTNPDDIAEPQYATDQYLGSVYPTFNYGFSMNLRLFQRFTLTALGEGAGGHVALNNFPWQSARRNLWPECNDRQPLTDQAAIWRARCAGPLQDRESWIRPADYFKLRTIGATYQVPKGVVPGAESASLSLQIQNPWKWSKHPGLDPELTRGGTFAVFPARYEYYQLSPARLVTVAARLSY